MWLIPLLLIGVIAVAAASKSSRAALPAPPLQLPPGPNVAVAGSPGPIAVLGEVLRLGHTPPPQVILCAIAEAESLGRNDLVADIVRVFVAPVVHRHQRANARPMAPPPPPPQHERGTCAKKPRGTCASPRAEADRTSVPMPPAAMPSAAVPQITQRPATEEEILAMLHTDPKVFLAMVSSGRPPVIDMPIAPPPAVAPPPPPPPPMQSVPPAQPIAVPPPAPPVDLVAQLSGLPGFAGAGVVRLGPAEGDEVHEVQWLRGHQVPQLPQSIEGRPLLLVIIDTLPEMQPAGLPAEAVAQMQEDAGLPEAADQTRAMAPGSPLGGISDDAWRQFVMRLAREAPTFDSSRHVGQFRQRRERLAELGIDPRAIFGSAAAQRAALDADLVDAHRHAAAGGMFEHLGRAIAVPGQEGSKTITLSGVLGVIQCAGLDGAVGWLERPNDRKRYPHTTQAFLNSNGVF